MPYYKWTIKDSNGNSIQIVQSSRSKAEKQFKKMFGRMAARVRIESCERGAQVKVKASPGRIMPVDPILNENKIGPNDKCSCGSGKKYKRCCMRKGK